MPTPATDRRRLSLVAIAIISMALSALAFRVVNGAAAAMTKPVPAPDLQGLTSFLGPVLDTPSLAVSASGTMVGERDPFGAGAPVIRSVAPVPGGTGARPTTGGSRQWVVSSILIEESRRSAIVNNAWVGVGDALGGGARVTAIERKHVIVTDANGNRHVVPIQGGAR